MPADLLAVHHNSIVVTSSIPPSILAAAATSAIGEQSFPNAVGAPWRRSSNAGSMLPYPMGCRGAGRIRQEPSGTALAGSRPLGCPPPSIGPPILAVPLGRACAPFACACDDGGCSRARLRPLPAVRLCDARAGLSPLRWMNRMPRMLVSIFEASATVAGSPGGALALALFRQPSKLPEGFRSPVGASV